MRKGKPIIIGQIFGLLTVFKISPKKGKRNESYFECICKCGGSKTVRGSKLNEGSVSSCGCKWHSSTHGLSKSTEYHIWQNMRERCNNPNHPYYNNYGGRGISVCDKWDKSFTSFYFDMGPRPSLEHTIERIDNDGNYEPANCKWDTYANQSKNRRNNRKITFNGETMCLKDWALKLNLQPDCLRQRLNYGWPIEKAFNTKSRASRVHKI